MEEIVNMIALDASAHDISDAIKDELYNRAYQKIEDLRPEVAASIFDSQEDQEESAEEE